MSGSLTPTGVKELNGFGDLRTLDLGEIGVTDSLLQTLREVGLLHAFLRAKAQGGVRPKNSGEVVALDLSRTAVTDAALKELVPLQQLQILDLRGIKELKGPGIKDLKELKNLKTLDLDDEQVTDAALLGMGEGDLWRAFAKAKGKENGRPANAGDVVMVDLSKTKATDLGLKSLAGLLQLQALDLRGTAVTGAGLKDLKGLKNLKMVSLDDGQVTDELLHGMQEADLMRAFSRAKGKEGQPPTGAGDVLTVDLSKTKVTDAGLKELASLPELQELNLRNTAVTGAGMKDLKGLKKLVKVVLADTQVADAELRDLKELQTVQSLDLTNTWITDAGLRDLKDLKGLKELTLTGTLVTPAGQKKLNSVLPQCKINP